MKRVTTKTDRLRKAVAKYMKDCCRPYIWQKKSKRLKRFHGIMADCICAFIVTKQFPWLGKVCPVHGRTLVVTRKEVEDHIKEINDICGDCATKVDAKWPDGHCATASMNECFYCGELKSMCALGDYNWPDKVKRGEWD